MLAPSATGLFLLEKPATPPRAVALRPCSSMTIEAHSAMSQKSLTSHLGCETQLPACWQAGSPSLKTTSSHESLRAKPDSAMFQKLLTPQLVPIGYKTAPQSKQFWIAGRSVCVRFYAGTRRRLNGRLPWRVITTFGPSTRKTFADKNL